MKAGIALVCILLLSCGTPKPITESSTESKAETTQVPADAPLPDEEEKKKKQGLTKEEAKKIYMKRQKRAHSMVVPFGPLYPHLDVVPIERTVKKGACWSCPIVVVPGERMGPIRIGMTASEIETIFEARSPGCKTESRIEKEINGSYMKDNVPFEMTIDGLYEVSFDKEHRVIEVQLDVNDVQEDCLEIKGHRGHRTKTDILQAFEDCHDMHLFSGATHIPCEEGKVVIMLGGHGGGVRLTVVKEGLTRSCELYPGVLCLPQVWDEELKKLLHEDADEIALNREIHYRTGQKPESIVLHPEGFPPPPPGKWLEQGNIKWTEGKLNGVNLDGGESVQLVAKVLDERGEVIEGDFQIKWGVRPPDPDGYLPVIAPHVLPLFGPESPQEI